MEIDLAYGATGMRIGLPDARTTVVSPTWTPPLPDPGGALREAIASPLGGGPRLRDIVWEGARVAISVCDVTRPQPRELMLDAVLEEIAGSVGPGDVTVLVATGTHRACTREELADMLGEQILRTCRVVNHDARDEASLVDLGVMGQGVPVTLNREWVEADVRITTGFVEPHFFAGFSGGPKMVAPGLAGLRTVLTLHDAARIGDPAATWGVCEGNPVHDDIRAIAAETGVDFSLDVVLNRDHDITGAFAGRLDPMHRAAREAARSVAMQPVDQRFDVVVTTNSGYPLDQNLYQAVKGMSAAANVVRPGGLIICAAECRDGLPEHGGYADMLRQAPDLDALQRDLLAGGPTRPDQWQVQVQARILALARVMVHCRGLDADQLRAAHVEPCADIELAVTRELERRGPAARVCVLPEGPQTIPFVGATAEVGS